MKKFLMISMTAILVALPGIAAATHWEAVELFVDCSGWNAKVDVYYGGPVQTAEGAITVVVTDDTGNAVATETWSDTLVRDGEPNISSFTITGSWTDEFCGEVTVLGTFELTTPLGDTGRFYTDTQTAAASMDCPCNEDPDPEPACTFTPGFWKNHPEAWPVSELELGGTIMSQGELLEIMFTPVRGDATIILAKHLIAAKLNVANGANDRIQPVIDRADGLLEGNEVGSKPKRRVRARALALKCILCAYNEMGCSRVLPDDDGSDKSLPSDEQATTWGDLKANYR